MDGSILFLDAEIRCDQSVDRKRAFALKTFAYVDETFDVPDENIKVVFTEHPDKSMMASAASGGE